MLILAIDTSEEIGVIALGSEQRVLAEYDFHCRMSLLRRLLPNIERVLDDSGHTVNNIDGIVVALGPGSFTGLRIGVTTAKSLAYTLGKPVVGVGTLDAIALSSAPTASDLICPMIHARSGEVFWALYDATGEMRIVDPDVSTVHSVLTLLAERGQSIHFCGSGASKNHEDIRHKLGNNATVAAPRSEFGRGAALLDIGSRRLREGSIDDAMSLTPLYIRKPTPVIRLETGEFERSTPSPGGEGRGEGTGPR